MFRSLFDYHWLDHNCIYNCLAHSYLPLFGSHLFYHSLDRLLFATVWITIVLTALGLRFFFAVVWITSSLPPFKSNFLYMFGSPFYLPLFGPDLFRHCFESSLIYYYWDLNCNWYCLAPVLTIIGITIVFTIGWLAFLLTTVWFTFLFTTDWITLVLPFFGSKLWLPLFCSPFYLPLFGSHFVFLPLRGPPFIHHCLNHDCVYYCLTHPPIYDWLAHNWIYCCCLALPFSWRCIYHYLDHTWIYHHCVDHNCTYHCLDHLCI